MFGLFCLGCGFRVLLFVMFAVFLVFGLGLVVFVRADVCVGVLFVRLFAVLFV